MLCPNESTRTKCFLIALVAALTTSCGVEAVPSDGHPLFTQALDAGPWEAQSEDASGDGKSSEADDDSRFVVAPPRAIPPSWAIVEPAAADASLLVIPKPFEVPNEHPYGP